MWNAASLAESLHDAAEYGFDAKLSGGFDWARVKKARDAYIVRLNVRLLIHFIFAAIRLGMVWPTLLIRFL